jgi:hypothetical protein
MAKDEESEKAAAHLYRLALAQAFLRLFAQYVGRPAESTEELGAWVQANRTLLPRPLRPSEEDYAVVEEENPKLVVLANRSNPYLSRNN